MLYRICIVFADFLPICKECNNAGGGTTMYGLVQYIANEALTGQPLPVIP